MIFAWRVFIEGPPGMKYSEHAIVDPVTGQGWLTAWAGCMEGKGKLVDSGPVRDTIESAAPSRMKSLKFLRAFKFV
jgi:hypothetical protein